MKNKKNIVIGIFLLLCIGSVGAIVFNNSKKSLSEPKKEKNIFEMKTNNIDGQENVLEFSLHGDYLYSKPDDMYKIADLVVIATYQNDIKTEITSYTRPYTYANFKINKILKNDKNMNLSEDLVVMYPGGTISLEEYLKVAPKDSKLVDEVTILSDEQIKNTKVKYFIEGKDNDLNNSRDRVLFLKYDEKSKNFYPISDYYGMISYDQATKKAYDNLSGELKEFSFLK